jgi:hypothetical protein
MKRSDTYSLDNSTKPPGADFSYIFFRGKSLSAEKSAEFLGKMIFQNFFRRKIHFIPTFFGGKFSAEFSPKFSPEKNVRKISPWDGFHLSTVCM